MISLKCLILFDFLYQKACYKSHEKVGMYEKGVIFSAICQNKIASVNYDV